MEFKYSLISQKNINVTMMRNMKKLDDLVFGNSTAESTAKAPTCAILATEVDNNVLVGKTYLSIPRPLDNSRYMRAQLSNFAVLPGIHCIPQPDFSICPFLPDLPLCLPWWSPAPWISEPACP